MDDQPPLFTYAKLPPADDQLPLFTEEEATAGGDGIDLHAILKAGLEEAMVQEIVRRMMEINDQANATPPPPPTPPPYPSPPASPVTESLPPNVLPFRPRHKTDDHS